MKQPFAGIIAYGGWMGGKKFQDLKYTRYMAVAMINGESDKNARAYEEGDSASLKKSFCVCRTFPWPGAHAIAPASVTSEALAWIDAEWKKRP